MNGDNPSGADDQQERPGAEPVGVGKRVPTGHRASGLGSWNPQRPYADQLGPTPS